MKIHKAIALNSHFSKIGGGRAHFSIRCFCATEKTPNTINSYLKKFKNTRVDFIETSNHYGCKTIKWGGDFYPVKRKGDKWVSVKNSFVFEFDQNGLFLRKK